MVFPPRIKAKTLSALSLFSHGCLNLPGQASLLRIVLVGHSIRARTFMIANSKSFTSPPSGIFTTFLLRAIRGQNKKRISTVSYTSARTKRSRARLGLERDVQIDLRVVAEKLLRAGIRCVLHEQALFGVLLVRRDLNGLDRL